MKKYFKDTGNYISFVLALVPSIILYIFLPSKPIPYFVFAITILLLLIVVWLCVKLYLDLKSSSSPKQINIINCLRNRCICEINDSITHNSIITFYEKVDECEIPLCFGVVETITTQGFAQVVIYTYNQEQTVEYLLSYIREYKNKILVRSTITEDKLQIINNTIISEAY